MKKAFYPGLKKILFPLQKARDFLDTSGPPRVMYGPVQETAVGEGGHDLVGFLKQVSLFTDLTHGDLRRLARIVHERAYRDGEIIFEQRLAIPTITVFKVFASSTVRQLKAYGLM